jgi:hypothetical protein
VESVNLQKKLTKIGLFDRYILVELNPLSDDDGIADLPNQLLLEETLCCNLDPYVKQCGC